MSELHVDVRGKRQILNTHGDDKLIAQVEALTASFAERGGAWIGLTHAGRRIFEWVPSGSHVSAHFDADDVPPWLRELAINLDI